MLWLLDPSDAHDFIIYGSGMQWVSPYTYRYLFDALHDLVGATGDSMNDRPQQ